MKKKPALGLEEIEFLKNENRRLKELLAGHGIAWEGELETLCRPPVSEPGDEKMSSTEKIRIFRRLFRGRNDVFAIRWESASGRSGYAPACENEWKHGICNKPKIKCAECEYRKLLPLTDRVILDHLTGKHAIGIYPLVEGDKCFFIAADFDGKEWREDSLAYMRSCKGLDIPAALEVSRSGNGAHVWIFFPEPVPARSARQLGASLISHTCDSIRQLALSSYDRFFPNQDTLPRGGFGNLIALPLQKNVRDQKRTVFVDDSFVTFPDQWKYLASIPSISEAELENAILRASGGRHPLDVAVILEEEDATPWKRQKPLPDTIPGLLPKSLKIVLADQIYFAKDDLPQPLANRLIRLAAFQNPEFHKAQAMRLSVWNKPRVIGCAENFPKHIGLPRGCLEPVLELLKQNDIRPEIQDERHSGRGTDIEFTGKLRKDQEEAVTAMLGHEIGVLCAPTAFRKTVTAAAIIARRKVSTFVMVHRTELLRQWQEQLSSFLEMPGGGPGLIGGGKNRPGGVVDIAVMQTLSRIDDLQKLLDGYGHIVIDECHHISAFSFEAIMKQAKARYVTGLTATPIRRDGHQPIIFMQCGPVRHSAARPDNAPTQLEVRPQFLPAPDVPQGVEIQELFRVLASDTKRCCRIANDVIDAYREGRKILVLTERTQHIELLREALGDSIEHCFVLHGRMSGKQRAGVLADIFRMDEITPRVIIATGRLIGEGFDHPPLDTLFLAMPISWKGTLQQYAGRLHREHAEKMDVRIYDYVELEHPVLAHMWDKRLRGYRAMGYRIDQSSERLF